MFIITSLERFEMTNKTLATIQETQTNQTYNLLASFETDFEQLILNPNKEQK